MRVLCLAGDRTIAYLIKHVLQFEGFAVEVCRSQETLTDGLADGAGVVVTAEPLLAPLPSGAAVVVAPDPFDERRLVLAVRRAAARAVAGLARPDAETSVTDLPAADAADSAGEAARGVA